MPGAPGARRRWQRSFRCLRRAKPGPERSGGTRPKPEAVLSRPDQDSCGESPVRVDSIHPTLWSSATCRIDQQPNLPEESEARAMGKPAFRELGRDECEAILARN